MKKMNVLEERDIEIITKCIMCAEPEYLKLIQSAHDEGDGKTKARLEKEYAELQNLKLDIEA